MRTDVAELERRARGLLSREVYDYYAGGSGHEETLRANAAAWRHCQLLPRALRDVSVVDTSVRLPELRLPGQPETELATPIGVAPTGFQRLAHPGGECATAEGAARAGALTVLSTRSSSRIEDVGDAVAKAGGAWWFQVYVLRDRDLTAHLVSRAVAAGARALVLTADTPEPGRKRRGHGGTPVTEEQFYANTGPLADPARADQAADVTFADIRWLARIGDVPILVKGVLRPDDAHACIAAGAAGVIVSNHGGRQLDRAIATAQALPAIVAALRGENGRGGEVFVDGGLRTAEDVLTALALGARAVFLGRPVLWALACGGADGVHDLLAGLTDDLAHVMALAGAASVAELPGLAEPPG
ncbi:MAG TPA: alpha-hydroxy acid oxidase [Streptosporangiaceae bacterium]